MQKHNLMLTVLLVSLCMPVTSQVKSSAAPYSSPTSGKQMFENYCSSCHGKQGKGDGPAAEALKTKPADLTTLAKRNDGRFPADRVTAVLNGTADMSAHGSKEMPVWGPVFHELSGGNSSMVQMRIGNLVTYLKSIQAK